jgi:hypothetical protein
MDGISGSDEQRAKQTAFKRAAETLLAAEMVGAWQEHRWVT